MYCLVNKVFQIDSLCRAGSLIILPNIDPKVVKLDVILNYQGLPKLNQRAATK